MFQKDTLSCVLSLERLVGGRRYGHFDHDAANISGPFSSSSSTEIAPLFRKASATEVGILVVRDPYTGEFLPAPYPSGQSRTVAFTEEAMPELV